MNNGEKNINGWWVKPLTVLGVVGTGYLAGPAICNMGLEGMGLRVRAPEAKPAAPRDWGDLDVNFDVDGLVCRNEYGGPRNDLNPGCVRKGSESISFQLEQYSNSLAADGRKMGERTLGLIKETADNSCENIAAVGRKLPDLGRVSDIVAEMYKSSCTPK